MKVQPIASPAAVQQSAPTDSRAKAIAAFNQSQPAPVQNPSQVSAEEMTAITGTSGQSDRSEPLVEETAPVEAPLKAPVEDPALSRQFAQLARQEKALRAKAQQQEQQYKAREEALKAREAELAGKTQVDPKSYYTKDQIKQDYLQVLLDAGVPVEEAVQQLVNTSQAPIDPRLRSQMQQLQAKIQELEEQNKSSQTKAQEAQTQQYQAAVKQIEQDARNLVKNDPAFDIIRSTNSVSDVVELITETFNKDGILLSVEEAAEQVENYLEEQALKLAKIPKVQKRYSTMSGTSTTAAQPGKTPGKVQGQPQPMKTLTNATSSTRQLSAKERAVLAFKGELKS